MRPWTRKLALATVVLLIAVAAYATLQYRASMSRFQGPEGKYFDSAGVKIHYTIDGEGPPLLLLHGLLLNGNVTWRTPGHIAKLAQRYTVVDIDLRGHGLSGKPHEAEAYGMETVEDLTRLMDALHMPKANLAGISLGGLVAESFMIAHPDRVLSVFVASQGMAEPDQENIALANGAADSLQHGMGIGPLNDIIGVTSTTQKLGLWYAANFMNDPVAVGSFVRQLPALAAPQDRIKANLIPLHIVIGENDGFLSWAQHVAKLKPNTDLHILPHRYHMNVGPADLMDLLLAKPLANVAAK